jgi:hypothetical protein
VAHLAQLNIARLAHDLDHPALQPFVDALDSVNAVADSAPGFVWRWEEPTHSPERLRLFGYDMIVNLSVWADLAALETYVYDDAHLAVLRQRRSFFRRMETPHLALWWVPEGHRPGLEEARERLDRVAADGATPHAFTLRQAFDTEGAPLR